MPTVADIAKLLQARAGRRHAAARRLPALLLMSDETRLPDPLAALARLPRGSGVILRHYGVPAREALARALVAKAGTLGIRVLVGVDARLALRLACAGLHIPEARARAPLALGPMLRRKSKIVTIAAHSLSAVFRAARQGATAAILGPVFTTASHQGGIPLGPLRFARFCRKSPIPVYAVGGIGPKTAPRLKNSGAVGFAGIGAIGLPRGERARGMARRRALV